MKTPIQLIDDERSRQIQQEGWTPGHDDSHDMDELATAAACYATPDDEREYDGNAPKLWRWDESWWKPTPGDRIRELVKAGALIVAEIERLQRAGLAK